MNTHPEDELPPRRDFDDAAANGLVETFDPYPPFRDQLASIVDIDRIRAAEKRVLVETLYGSGSGWYTRLLGDGRLTVRELHTERNPYFGGVNPEPIRPNVDEWLKEISPSTELRKWYSHDPSRFDEFVARYTAELESGSAAAALDELRAAVREGPVTLVTATRDVEGSHAAVLAKLLS